MSSPLHVVRAGTAGPPLVLVHGSATDAATWTIQLAMRLPASYQVVAYDRRGAGRSPRAALCLEGLSTNPPPSGHAPMGPPPDTRDVRSNAAWRAWHSIEEHAADLAQVIGEVGAPALVAGSSCGAAVVLEACRRTPALVRGAILIEPPLAADDVAPSVPPGFLAALDALAAERGPEAAAERFLITVLGEEAWARLPRMFRERSAREWPQIRGDCYALDAYRVRYAALGTVTTPVRLLGGDRSAPYFRPTLEALAAALPAATLTIVPGAGHMLHADTPRAFADVIDALATATT